MKRTKLVFLLAAILFFIILAFFAYDIAKRTTFPGKKTPVDTEQTN